MKLLKVSRKPDSSVETSASVIDCSQSGGPSQNDSRVARSYVTPAQVTNDHNFHFHVLFLSFLLLNVVNTLS